MRRRGRGAADDAPSSVAEDDEPALVSGVVRFDGVRPGPTPLRVVAWSFDGVVRRVLAFSRAAELEDEASRLRQRVAPVRFLARSRTESSPAFDALTLFVRSLDRETQGKLRAVMKAGRDAEPLPTAAAAIPDADRELEVFGGGAAALQDLQRGHAVACATAFDLELALAHWSAVGKRKSVDERAWLRFGRELARSHIEEWSCCAVVAGGEQLKKLYLRRGQNRWWSFGSAIDRPSHRDLERARSSRSSPARIVTLSVQAALGRSCGRNQRALQRASLALSARLGMCRIPLAM